MLRFRGLTKNLSYHFEDFPAIASVQNNWQNDIQQSGV
jgi:hypothetical protein